MTTASDAGKGFWSSSLSLFTSTKIASCTEGGVFDAFSGPNRWLAASKSFQPGIFRRIPVQHLLFQLCYSNLIMQTLSGWSRIQQELQVMNINCAFKLVCAET